MGPHRQTFKSVLTQSDPPPQTFKSGQKFGPRSSTCLSDFSVGPNRQTFDSVFESVDPNSQTFEVVKSVDPEAKFLNAFVCCGPIPPKVSEKQLDTISQIA